MTLLISAEPSAVSNTVTDTISKLDELANSIIYKIGGAVPNVILGLVILSVGLFLIRTLLKVIDKRFAAKNLDLSLRGFLRSIISFILYGLLIITVISNIGIQTTSFIAILTAVGLGVGASLQGSLSNFAGGVLILIFRPYEVDDYIENNSGTEGTVKKIDLLYTTLENSNGIIVFSPNGPLVNSVIRNFTKASKRRIEYIVGISYNDNIKTAKDIILTVVNTDNRVLKNPAAEVYVNALADSSVNLTVRIWTSKSDYWDCYTTLQEKIKVELDANGISIPFPQSDIHIIPNDIK